MYLSKGQENINDNVHVATVLVSPKNMLIPCRILNNSNKEVTLAPGQPLGTAYPAPPVVQLCSADKIAPTDSEDRNWDHAQRL